MNIVSIKGLTFIKAKLQEHHKQGRKIAAYAQHLERWVDLVEANVNNGTGAYFEISALESVSGHPVVISLPTDAIVPVKH